MARVFTYGTLMKDQRNHYLLENSKYLGDAYLKDYGLLEIGTYPAAVKMEGFTVYGEVYEVDECTKKDVDQLEDEGNLYKYKNVAVIMNDEEIEVGFYEFIDKGHKYPIRKPLGKWNMIRQDI